MLIWPSEVEEWKLRTSARTIWSISVPLVIFGINDTLVEVSNTIFLARFGIIELGASALAYSIYETAKFFMLALGEAIQIITARRAGETREKEIGDAFNHGVTLLLATSAILFLLLKFGSPHVTAAILRSDNVRVAVDDFLGILAYALFFDSLNHGYYGFYSGIGRTKVFIKATTVMAVMNLAGDYLLIFGNLGFPRLGIKGAAISSLLAEITIFVFLTAGTLKRGYVRRFGLFRLRLPQPSLTKLILMIASPVALQRLIEKARWFLFFAIIEQTGENPLAIANIVYSCYVLFLIMIDGFSETACTMVSNLIGQDQSHRINSVIRSIMLWTGVFLAPFLFLALLFPEVALSLFTSDSDLLRGCVNSLRVVSLAVLVAIPGELTFSAVAGTGDTRATLVIELLLSVCILACAFSAAIVFGLPLEMVWAAEIVGWLLNVLLSYAWLNSRHWKRVHI